MSVHVLTDHPTRRPSSRPGAKRTPRRKPTPQVTRAALVADFLAVCELDGAVESLRACEEPVTFLLGEEEIAHTPEFELIRDGASCLIDVVPEAELASHPLRTAFVAGGLEAEDGRLYVIETSSTIRAEPRFTTVKLILACRRTPVSAGDRVRILHHLDECSVAPLVECAGAAQNALDGVAAVLALACEGLVQVDINRPILPETPVRRRKLSFVEP